MEKQPCIYILFNKKHGTLYVGVTSNLIQRVYQHKNKMIDGFSKKYETDKLGYYELIDTLDIAIQREKQIKAGSRKKKIELIEKMNPGWVDLYEGLEK